MTIKIVSKKNKNQEGKKFKTDCFDKVTNCFFISFNVNKIFNLHVQ